MKEDDAVISSIMYSYLVTGDSGRMAAVGALNHRWTQKNDQVQVKQLMTCEKSVYH